ncbi:hypothetical protein MBCUT_18740 [Methanobrevibacter cuticularis]|uniref:Uncharacterized protein n=1 Tax=Methanobrevibacter cuticularis TaxID=47311 RepID=A0A166CUM3_9EURY|nr:hypothetical protein MBCUT_18740 [Methanobrevibacter cuticularis]
MKVIVVAALLLYIAPPLLVVFLPLVNVMFMKATFKLTPIVNIRLDPCASIITSAVGPFPCIVTFLLIVIPVLLPPV